MSLTPEADAAARYLAQAKDQEMVSSYFELVDLTAGSVTDFNIGSGLGVHSDNFIPPSLGAFRELAHNNLIDVSDLFSSRGRKWGVTLLGTLWDYVSGKLKLSNANSSSFALPTAFISYSH